MLVAMPSARKDLRLPVQTREVISYEDDVFAWVYLDQVDQLLRYEAYVIGYDDAGRPATLAFVLEEGLVDEAAYPELHRLLAQVSWQHPLGAELGIDLPHANGHQLSEPGGDVLPSLAEIYRRLDRQGLERLHAFFAHWEARLKQRHRARWIRRLRALGYDILPSL